MSRSMNIENPNESLVVPKWLNKSKFESLIAKDEPDFTKIDQFTTVAAVPPGGNFASVMLRVYLDIVMKGRLVDRDPIYRNGVVNPILPRWISEKKVVCGQDYAGI